MIELFKKVYGVQLEEEDVDVILNQKIDNKNFCQKLDVEFYVKFIFYQNNVCLKMIYFFQQQRNDFIVNLFRKQEIDNHYVLNCQKLKQFIQNFKQQKICDEKKRQLFLIIFQNIENFKINKKDRKIYGMSLDLMRVLCKDKLIINEKKQLYINTINSIYYFQQCDEIKKQKGNTKLTILLIKIIRNLIFNKIHKFNKEIVNTLLNNLKYHIDNKDIVVDYIRIFSKISESKRISNIIVQNDLIYNLFSIIYQKYQTDNYILAGLLQFIANLLTFNEKFQQYIYSSDLFNNFIEMFESFNKNEQTLMSSSFTSFQFLSQNKNENLEKIIRIFANVFTNKQNSELFIQNNYQTYKNILKILKTFFNQKSKEIPLLALLSFLTNIFYYDNALITYNDFELQKLKLDLLLLITNNIDTQNVTTQIESLRTIANLSKNKEIKKQLLKINFNEKLQNLLKSDDDQIVYNSLGCLLNLTNQSEFYNKKEMQFLVDINSDNENILYLTLQMISNIINYYKMNDIQIKQIDLNLVVNFFQQTNIENHQQFNQLQNQIKGSLEYFKQFKFNK